ncbi:uncharacterized protein METZ01_LOCUS389491, partial [marine metagenome]
VGEEGSHLEWLKEKAGHQITKGFLETSENLDCFRERMKEQYPDWEPLGLMAEEKYYMLPFRNKSEYGIPNSGEGIRIGPKTGYLADRPGIYLIAIPEKETYIGESRNLEQRMDGHWRSKPNELKDVPKFAGLIIIKSTGTRGEDLMRSDAFRCTLERVLKSVIHGVDVKVHEGERVDKWVWPNDAEIDEIEKLSKEIMRLLEVYRSKEEAPNLLSDFMEFSSLDKKPIPSDFLSRES